MSGIDIVVIDASSDDNGFLAAARSRNPGALLVRSVEEMATTVLARAAGRPIGRLIIIGHGAPGLQGVGDGQGVQHPNPPSWVGDGFGQLANPKALELLSRHFTVGGIVELHGCNVALHHFGRELLRQLSDLWGVRVRAGTEAQHWNHLNGFDGPVIEAAPVPGHHAHVHLVSGGMP